MNNVNYTFGVLCGVDSKTRYSNCVPTESQKKYLVPLWKKETDRGALAEFLVRLLRCSEHWPEFCASHDKINTYNIDVDVKKISIDFEDLVTWADECPCFSEKYNVHRTQTAVDRVINRLFGVLTSK